MAAGPATTGFAAAVAAGMAAATAPPAGLFTSSRIDILRGTSGLGAAAGCHATATTAACAATIAATIHA